MAHDDSTQTFPQSPSSYTGALQSLSCSKHSPPPTQTLDRQSTSSPTEVDYYPTASSFDETSQQHQHSNSSESQHVNEIKPSTAEANAVSETSSPLLVDDTHNNIPDETDAWISCNTTQADAYKPSSSSSWYEDVYEKPSTVGAGLANLGNTCFFNAVFQCFTHSVLLVQGLYAYNHTTPCDCYNERFCLICALREHIDLSLSSTTKIVSPWKFVNNLNYFSSSFQRFQQEDAHEFLQCFLDRLESSLCKLKAKDVFSSQGDNLVKQVFGGCVVSKLRCCNCNHTSDTYEPSVDLSLEIDDANSLSTALESFTKVEHIEDEEMKFTCDQCKEKVSVQKQLMLDQTPPVCAFHLKRFKNDGSYVEKIDKHVEFPLELDLQPYTCGKQGNYVDLQYKLYAVVVHEAFTSSCGHYYCYIRSAPDTWYKFDDSKVTNVSEACVLSEEAYILFYARQGTPWFSNFMKTYKPSFDPNLSNTSPKSVLENVDHNSTSTDSANIHSHDINDSFIRSGDNRVADAGAKDHPSESDAVGPLRPINSCELNASDHVINEKNLLTLKEYGSNHRLEVEKHAGLTPTSHNTSGGDNFDTVFSAHFMKPNDSSGGKSTFEMEKVVSPSTPPRSPGLDLSDDENPEVVFAPMADQLKVVEKVPSYKRQRNKDVEDSAKHEALRQCKRMPAARGNLLMAALGTPLVSKRSKSPQRKKLLSSRSRERFNHHNKSISRNLATSSFR